MLYLRRFLLWCSEPGGNYFNNNSWPTNLEKKPADIKNRLTITVVSKFVGPVGQSDIFYEHDECTTKNVGMLDQMSDRNYKKISI